MWEIQVAGPRDQARRKCGKTVHFQNKYSQGYHNGGRKFEKGKTPYGQRGKFRGGERLLGEVRQSPHFACCVGQSTDHLSLDNAVVTLNVGGVDLSNLLIDSGPADIELVES